MSRSVCIMYSMIRWRLDPGQIEVVDDAIAVVLRTKTPGQRLAMMFAANRTMRLMLEGSIARENQDWTRKQVLVEVARRMSGGTS
jgi:Arc/MetJ family transcription regulator